MRCDDREREFLAENRARLLGRVVEWHDILTSTQDRADELARAGAAEGTVVVAAVQNAGRGRNAARWHAAEGGLWASLVLYPPGSAGQACSLTLLLARAVRETLHYDFCVAATIKEPNDVLVGGMKIAGILAEATSRAGQTDLERMVLGLGLNVGNALDGSVTPGATRLADHLGQVPPVGVVLARVLERFDRLYEAYEAATRRGGA